MSDAEEDNVVIRNNGAEPILNDPAEPLVRVRYPTLELYGRISLIPEEEDPMFFRSDFDDLTDRRSASHNYRWCNEYSKDIIASLKSSEKLRKKMKFISPQADYRTNLIILLDIAWNTFGLNLATKHLAIHYLDIFMDSYKVSDDKLDLIAMICLTLASKVEDIDVKIPKREYLQHFIKERYHKSAYSYVEKTIIKCFSWNLSRPTAATYIELYCVDLIRDDDTLPWGAEDDFKIRARSELFEYLQTSLFDVRLSNEPPSMLAAVCMFCTRKKLNIEPVWPKRLKLLTGYSRNVFMLFAYALIEQRKVLKSYTDGARSPDSGIYDSYSIDEEYSEDEDEGCGVLDEEYSSDSEDGIEDLREYFREPKRRRLA